MDDWLIWQVIDSAFPTGGFAHSAGLETAWRHEWVNDGASLAEFIHHSIRQMQRGVIVYLSTTFTDPGSYAAADEACDLFINNHVANRASRGQGQAFLRASLVFKSRIIAELAARSRQDRRANHFAPVFGIVCRELEVNKQVAINMFLFMAVRSIVSAAVRLGIIGPMEAQQIQADFAKETNLPGIPSLQHPVQIAPLQDLLQGTHDRLYSRLFQT